MDKQIRLICLPYAGGSRYSFREFQKRFPSFIELIAVEYPGRGARFSEPLLSDVNELVDDIFLQVRKVVEGGHYAVYGHSMGGLVGWLLARKIAAAAMQAPLHLFISGTAGPASKTGHGKKRHLLPRAEFLEEIRMLAGSPDEVMKDTDLVNYYEPILRSDFKACECYRHDPSTAPLQLPFTVITGTEEELTEDEIRLWEQETTGKINFIRLQGNHFFIMEQCVAMTEIIKQPLLSALDRCQVF